jgi:hypothetical protein
LRSYTQAKPTLVAEFTAAVVQAQAMSANSSVTDQALATCINGMTPMTLLFIHPDGYPTALSPARLAARLPELSAAALRSRLRRPGLRVARAAAPVSRARSSCLACRSHFGMLRSLS